MVRSSFSSGLVFTVPLLAALAACSGESPRTEFDEPRSRESSAPRTGRDPEKTGARTKAPNKTAKTAKTDTAKTAKTDTAKTAKAARPRGTIIDALLKDLRDEDSLKVELAFWKLASVAKEHIPALIREVESEEPTRLTRIKMIVLEKDFVGERKLLLANRMHGLGKMEDVAEEDGQTVVQSKEYTDISYGIKNKRYQMVLDRIGGFPLGIVIRAGLINRFLSTRYPSWSDDDPAPGKLVDWWRAYYELSRDKL
jgi:hypothetical protein